MDNGLRDGGACLRELMGKVQAAAFVLASILGGHALIERETSNKKLLYDDGSS